MQPFSRRTMAKRSTAPSRRSREQKQFLLDVRGRRHREQRQRQVSPSSHPESAVPAPQRTTGGGGAEGGNSSSVFTFDRATEQANLQHLMALITSYQEDTVGQFFAAALTTIRRFSPENISAIRTLLASEVRKIQLEEFFENHGGQE